MKETQAHMSFISHSRTLATRDHRSGIFSFGLVRSGQTEVWTKTRVGSGGPSVHRKMLIFMDINTKVDKFEIISVTGHNYLSPAS